MKKINVFLIALISLLGFTGSSHAQGLAPFRAEYKKQAKGLLTLINDKDVPVRVSFRPQSFTSDQNGHLKLVPLDPSVNLVLSQTSLRIPAKQTRYISYEAKPAHAPAWFVIYATFVPETDGIVIGTSVPHFAYVTGGEPNREEIELAAKYISEKKVLRISLTSHSQQLAHVETLETDGRAKLISSFMSNDHIKVGNGAHKEMGSLTVLPGKTTVVDVKLQGYEFPGSVKATLRKFKLQCQVTYE